MTQTEKVVFPVFTKDADDRQSLYFFNWGERNKIAWERIKKVIREFWCDMDTIEIGDEIPLDIFQNVKKNIWDLLYLVEFDDKNIWLNIRIIDDEKIPFISDELYAKLGTKDSQELKNMWYTIADIIYNDFE